MSGSSEFDLLSVAADGMDVQRALLDVAARNVAAAQASTPAHPYQRLVAQVVPAQSDGEDPTVTLREDDGDDDGPSAPGPLVRTLAGGAGPDALTEMIAVLDAQRAYEADASVFDVGKRLAERTIDLGRL
ncbi:MAG TPA: hypothetical protein VMD91_06750 [Candidatus Sulfotelmatobacter sp.]|nr:hypothetical protein [Candidatus Sulfotelmatobacter sp.]